jgi:tetratricopeptide (TPR) repeat protein
MAQNNELFGSIMALIADGKLQDAELKLNAIVEDKTSSTADRLQAYAHLIRIAAEKRLFDRLPKYVDEVKKISLASDDERRMFAKCLHSTGTGWFYSGNYEKARQAYQAALEISEGLNAVDDILSTRLSLVEILRNDGQYQAVFDQLPQLRDLASKSGETSSLGKVYILEGNILRKTGEYARAIEVFEQAREAFSRNKNSVYYHYILWAIGTCYAAIEDKDKASIYLDLATNSFEGSEFARINILSLLTLAELHTIIGEYGKADSVYKKVADKIGSEEASYFGRRLLRGQGLLAIKKGEFDQANEMIDKLVVIAVREKSQKEIMRLRILKAEVLLRNGDSAQHEEARAMLQEALAFHQQRGVRRHQAVCLELLARLDSASGYPADALKKVEEMRRLAEEGSFDRLYLRASLARLVLLRKLGQNIAVADLDGLTPMIDKLNAGSERVILARFRTEGYEEWAMELRRLDGHAQRYVYEFFEDFHFIQNQAIDIEIDRNSHYVREKHLGEIPFHNKFTLMRILCLLAETPGKEFSKEQLAKEIWEQEYNPLRHDNNIYININRLRKLIEPNPRESRYVMNGSRGYYFNPAMKVNISSKISDVAPRSMPKSRNNEGARP